MSDYYVYAYLREDGTPYYIGKGKGRRAWNSHIRSNGHNVVPTNRSRIKILESNLSDDAAKQREIELIAYYGRKDLGTGILRNMTDGGEGKRGCTNSEDGIKRSAEASRQFQLTLLESNQCNFSESNNPNNIRVSCIVCKKETSFPSLKNHRLCNGLPPTHNMSGCSGENNPSRIRMSCLKCRKETGINGFSQHYSTHKENE